jgi:hypothetical protein
MGGPGAITTALAAPEQAQRHKQGQSLEPCEAAPAGPGLEATAAGPSGAARSVMASSEDTSTAIKPHRPMMRCTEDTTTMGTNHRPPSVAVNDTLRGPPVRPGLDSIQLLA